MIVELTVENYRSIKESQVFSLYAGDFISQNKESARYSELPDNITYLPNQENNGLGILKVAAVYGANASGKSNLLSAFDCLQDLLRFSGDFKEKEEIKFYTPYKLCEQNKTSPIKFEIEFFCSIELSELDHPNIVNPVRFIYTIEFNRFEIITESLSFYSKNKAKPAILFSRSEGQTWENIKFGSYYKGKRKRIPFFKNNCYLSKIGGDAAAPMIMKQIYEYLLNNIDYIPVSVSGVKIEGFKDKKDILDKTSKWLNLVDTGIIDIKSVECDVNEDELSDFFKALPNEVKARYIELNSTKTLFSHKGDSGFIENFEEDDLSAGTKKLFGFIPLFFMAFKHGSTIIIDELETKFHPHIAELIIRLFNDDRVNKKGAQLIFSSHSTEIMNSNLLRRDQIWFTENKKGVTNIYSLKDFDSNKVRADSPFAKWYLDGRLGAIPRFNYLDIADLFEDILAENQNDNGEL